MTMKMKMATSIPRFWILSLLVVFVPPIFSLLSSSSSRHIMTTPLLLRNPSIIVSAFRYNTPLPRRHTTPQHTNYRKRKETLLFRQPPPNEQDDKKESVSVQWNPTYLSIHQLSHSYPSTLWRTLFSSVPEREYALFNITLQSPAVATTLPSAVVPSRSNHNKNDKNVGGGGGEMILLVGASSSGKSALLKQIAGLEKASSQSSETEKENQTGLPSISIVSSPVHFTTDKQVQQQQEDIGLVTDNSKSNDVNNSPDNKLQSVAAHSVRPIILDRKPPFDNSRCVQDVLEDVYRKIEQDTTTTGSTSSSTTLPFSPPSRIPSPPQIQNAVIHEICELIGISKTLRQQTPSELSPSENYRFGLVIATLQSIVPTIIVTSSSSYTTTMKTSSKVVVDDSKGHKDKDGDKDDDDDDVMIIHIPSPLLLLDEWMDFETSTVIQRVEESLLQLCTQAGAIILCATHKPHLFAKQHSHHRTITLCRGEILSDTCFPLPPQLSSSRMIKVM